LQVLYFPPEHPRLTRPSLLSLFCRAERRVEEERNATELITSQRGSLLMFGSGHKILCVFFFFLFFTNYNYVQFTSFLYFRDRRRPQLRHFIFHKMFKVQRFAFNNICDPSPLFFFAPSQCGRCGQDATPPSHVPAFHSHSIFVQQCSSTPSLLHRAGAAGPEHTPFLAHPIRLFLYPSHLPPPQSLSCVQWQPPLGPEGEVAPP
jgi:hypothetical protein